VHSRLGFDRFKSGFVVNVRQFFGVSALLEKNRNPGSPSLL
jgi:hypothetical protein